MYTYVYDVHPAPPTSPAAGQARLRDNLREHVALLLDQRGGDPAQHRAPSRPDPRGVGLQRPGDLVEQLQPSGIDPPLSRR